MTPRKLTTALALAVVPLFAASCADAPTQPQPTGPAATPSLDLTVEDGVRISEIHYDNDGTDTGEAIELQGPAGTDLTGWSVVLYNGSSSQLSPYDTRSLSGTIPGTCGASGVIVLDYPSNGIQNGSPDGLALVNGAGDVVEFLSYEGTFTAGSGPAAGMTSTDIGVEETSSTPIGNSLQRTSLDSWSAPAENTFGACNAGGGDGGGGDPGDGGGSGGGGSSSDIYLSELHYDNDGADAGEAVEVSGPVGSDLTGWSVALYNGSNGTVYGTIGLSGTLPDGCGLVFPYSGIQNGAPDGLALVDAGGAVVEFLSYEGTMTATDGPANGTTSTDIGVAETSSTSIGSSLQRDAKDGAWYGPDASTFGCDDGGGDGGGSGDYSTDPLFLSEIRADEPSGSANEYFEVGGAAGASLKGIALVVIGDSPSGGGGVIEEVTDLTGNTLPASGALVVAESSFTLGTPDIVTSLDFENGDNPTYLLVRGFTGSNGQDLDTDDDGVLDATPWGEVADCVSLVEYLGKMPIYCDARIGLDVTFTPGHAVRDDAGWFSAVFTPGAGSPPGSDSPGILRFDPATAVAGQIAPWGVRPRGVPTAVSVNASFVQLPVGFNRALFITVVDDYRDEVDGATVTFTPADPSVVTSDPYGNLKAEGVGETTLTIAVAGDPSVSTDVDVDVIPDVPSGVAYQDHTEFGTPTDASPWDDILVRRDEYALSYSAARGGANWVAWDLDASHMGSSPRCECYTPDPALGPGAPAVVNFDFTGSGYSRGHVTQSANRTVTLPDNAATYYTSNILPMAAANNSGPWGAFENYTSDRARAGEEVYIVAGPEFGPNPTTLKDEGKVTVPDWTWKVAVFVGRDQTLADVRDLDDLEVIAIRTPNRIEAGVPGSVSGISRDWRDYVVTVDQIEAATGYDLLSALPNWMEIVIESGFGDLTQAFADAVQSGDVDQRAALVLGLQLTRAFAFAQQDHAEQVAHHVEVFLQQLDNFERQGKVTPAAAAALRAEAATVLQGLSGD